MSDGSEFLAEVIANPDDDVPRLIYADWLEDQGSPRGEFIRVQCELEQTDELSPQYLDLKHRNDELLKVHGDDWCREYKQDLRKTTYHRGFIDTITMTARALVKDDGKVFNAFPVRWLRLNYLQGTADLWENADVLRNVHFLSLNDLKIPEITLVAFLSSPHLCNLRGLKIGGFEQSFTQAIAELICSSRIAENLRELDFHGAPIDVSMLMDAARSSQGFPSLQSLRFLDTAHEASLNCDGITFGSLKTVCVGRLSVKESERLAKLPLQEIESLRVSSIPTEGVEALGQCGALNAVQELDLGHSTLGEKAAEALFCDERLSECHDLKIKGFRNDSRPQRFVDRMTVHEPVSNLRSLAISNLVEGQLTSLCKSPFLQNLQRLELSDCRLNAEDLATLADSDLGKSLRWLRLYHTCPPVEGFDALAEGLFTSMLTFEIDLQYSYGISTKNVEPHLISLLDSQALPALQQLTLQAVGLTISTLECVANSSQLSELRRIVFDGNDGSNDMMFAVLDSEQLPKLQHLSMKECRGLRRSKKIAEKYGDRLTY